MKSVDLQAKILDLMPSSVVVLDDHLKVVLHNRVFVRDMGLKAGVVKGRKIDEVLPDLFARETVLAGIRSVLSSGGMDELLDVRFLNGSGKTRYLNIIIKGLDADLPEGAGKAVLLMLDDVTHQHRINERLLQAARMESVVELAGGVAHDFNNILAGILGYAQLLLAECGKKKLDCRDLNQITALVKRAVDLTRQLLAFSRRQIISPRVLNLNDLINVITDMLHRVIGDDIRLRVTSVPDLADIKADADQVEQIFMNLATNARDAMPDGGELAISLTNVLVDIDLAGRQGSMPPGAYVLIKFRDTGKGMGREVKERLFEPFFTTKELGRGTGLGLSAVYGIVKEHGGEIHVFSEPGKGATFKIYLPVADGPAKVTKPDAGKTREN